MFKRTFFYCCKSILLSSILLVLLGSFIFLMPSCSEPKKPIKIERFEQELFLNDGNYDANHFNNLAKKYPEFYRSFAEDMLNISAEEAATHYSGSLKMFVNYPTIKQLKHEVDSVFPNLDELESELGKAMGIYHKEFPNSVQPKFMSFISEYGYANVAYDTIIGIGLDMYLGSHYQLYHALEFPDFMVQKLRKEYIVANTLKSLGISKYEKQLKDKRFLAMMLFEGKLRYFMKRLDPEMPDSILFGCSPEKLLWSKENEGMIWTHFIEQKLLFSSEVGQYMRYFNDGPFTIATGVPQESAPAIGVFIGYQIINKYMIEHGEISLSRLMENHNWDEILQQSSYRP